jgi:hypothetical protein
MSPAPLPATSPITPATVGILTLQLKVISTLPRILEERIARGFEVACVLLIAD